MTTAMGALVMMMVMGSVGGNVGGQLFESEFTEDNRNERATKEAREREKMGMGHRRRLG